MRCLVTNKSGMGRMVASVGAVALLFWVLLACRSQGGGAQAAETTTVSPVNELTWTYPNTSLGPSEVVVTVPKDATPSNRMPVLIALHGQGESRKTPTLGARGWIDDYGMIHAFQRLNAPPLNADDFGGMVTKKRLGFFNSALKKKPYRGLIVVCPYLPDRFRSKSLDEDAAKYGDFLLNTVLPRVYKETPAVATPQTLGIDGVSLGGRVAVMVGLTHPDSFGAVGGTQVAFRTDQVEEIAIAAIRARAENPKLRFRILSSDQDRFMEVTRRISSALKQRNVSHQMEIISGNHSYEFNRGPGVYEMLMYYDRALRGEYFQ